MDEEVTTAVSIPISLMIMSFVLAISMSIVYYTQQPQRDAIMRVDKIVAEDEVGDLKEIELYDKPVPVPIIVMQLVKNASRIHKLSGNVKGTDIVAVESLKFLTQYKAKVKVIPYNDYYDIILSD